MTNNKVLQIIYSTNGYHKNFNLFSWFCAFVAIARIFSLVFSNN